MMSQRSRPPGKSRGRLASLFVGTALCAGLVAAPVAAQAQAYYGQVTYLNAWTIDYLAQTSLERLAPGQFRTETVVWKTKKPIPSRWVAVWPKIYNVNGSTGYLATSATVTYNPGAAYSYSRVFSPWSLWGYHYAQNEVFTNNGTSQWDAWWPSATPPIN